MRQDQTSRKATTKTRKRGKVRKRLRLLVHFYLDELFIGQDVADVDGSRLGDDLGDIIHDMTTNIRLLSAADAYLSPFAYSCLDANAQIRVMQVMGEW